MVSELRYYPFGQERWSSGSTPTDRTFTGQRVENQSAVGSLMDYGARFYSPLLGRFISADSVVPEPSDPQSLNRYSYARNSPLVRIDPSGHGDCNIHVERCLPDDVALSHPVSKYVVFNFYHYMFYKLHNYYIAPQHVNRVKSVVYEHKLTCDSELAFRANPVNGSPSPVTNSEVTYYLSAPQPHDYAKPNNYNATVPDYTAISAGFSFAVYLEHRHLLHFIIMETNTGMSAQVSVGQQALSPP